MKMGLEQIKKYKFCVLWWILKFIFCHKITMGHREELTSLLDTSNTAIPLLLAQLHSMSKVATLHQECVRCSHCKGWQWDQNKQVSATAWWFGVFKTFLGMEQCLSLCSCKLLRTMRNQFLCLIVTQMIATHILQTYYLWFPCFPAPIALKSTLLSTRKLSFHIHFTGAVLSHGSGVCISSGLAYLWAWCSWLGLNS